MLEPPSRQRAGKAKLTVWKDRHGHIRGHAAHGTIALAHIDPADNGDRVTVTLEPPDPNSTGDNDEFRPTILMERASLAIEHEPGINTRELRDRITGSKSKAKDLAVAILIREDYVEARPGPRRALHHYSLAPFRTTVPDCAPTVPGTVSASVPHVPPSRREGHAAQSAHATQNNGTVPGTLLDKAPA